MVGSSLVVAEEGEGADLVKGFSGAGRRADAEEVLGSTLQLGRHLSQCQWPTHSQEGTRKLPLAVPLADV